MKRRSFLKFLAAVPLAVKAGDIFLESMAAQPRHNDGLSRVELENLMGITADNYYKAGIIEASVFAPNPTFAKLMST